MANTWLETALRPNTLPKLPPTPLERKRSHSMISSAQYRPLTTLQLNISALDTMHSPKVPRPMSGNRCSLPPIRDLLEVAELAPAGISKFGAFSFVIDMSSSDQPSCQKEKQVRHKSRNSSNTLPSTITTPTTRHEPIRLHNPPRISTSLHRATTSTNPSQSQRLLPPRLPNSTHNQLAILTSTSSITSTTSTATISQHVPSRPRPHRHGPQSPSEFCIHSICVVSSLRIFEGVVFGIVARGFCEAAGEETNAE
jgi:hypothetical protein